MQSTATPPLGKQREGRLSRGARFRALSSKEAITSPDGRLPLVIEPYGSAELPDLLQWLSANASLIANKLILHGGILFRGFNISSPDDFEQVAWKIDPSLRQKNPLDDGVRPHRTRFVFGATSYSALHTLPFHNEDSYLPKNPARIMFCCLKAPAAGGETVIVDCRRVYEDLQDGIVRLFRDKLFPVSRKFSIGTLSQNMGTSDRKAIEAVCEELGVEDIRWTEQGDCIISSSVPAIIYHDQTAEPIWFNRLIGASPWSFLIQACFSILRMRDFGLRLRAVLLLPVYLVYFAPVLVVASLTTRSHAKQDSVPHSRQPIISPRVAYQLARAYWRNSTTFAWSEGDILVLDNRLVAHGRMPFRGQRSLLTCVTQAAATRLTDAPNLQQGAL